MLTDKHFADWESHVFGYGYGTGEQHTLGALLGFFGATRDQPPHGYDYTHIEQSLGPAVAWLMINALCRDEVIEYGTSPRYGWLTERGAMLRAYLRDKSVDELYEVVLGDDASNDRCYPDHCNCEIPCINPLFGHPASRRSPTGERPEVKDGNV